MLFKFYLMLYKFFQKKLYIDVSIYNLYELLKWVFGKKLCFIAI